MSTLYGSNADKLLVDNPSTMLEPGEGDGRLRVIYDSYSLGGTALVTGDVLLMGSKIPQGAKIHDCRLVFTDLDAGAGARLDAGWQASSDALEAGDADGLGDSINVEAAGSYSTFTTQFARPGIGYNLTAAVQPSITVEAQGGTPATTGSIQMWLIYSRD